MGTTTQKLEYLGTTKSQLKDQINYGLPTEKQITSSTTFRNYVSSIFEAFLEALRNPDTLFTNLPKTSDSGSNITLNGTANAPMRITLNPTAISQTTYTGKNKYNATTTETTASNITHSANETILKVNGTRDSEGFVNFSYFTLPSGTYTLNVKLTKGSITNNFWVTIADSNNTEYVSDFELKSANSYTYSKSFTLSESKSLRFRLYVRAVTAFTNAELSYQVTTGSTSDYDFEPYVGGTASPNPSYPQDIHTISGNNSVVVEGKNLLNFEDGTFTDGANLTIKIENNKITLNGSTSANYLWINLTKKDYRYGTPNTSNKPLWFNTTLFSANQYTMSATSQGGNLRCFYTDGSVGASISSEKNVSSIGFYFANSGTSFTNKEIYIQVEYGNTATDYTPYVSQANQINLGEYELGTIGNYSNEFVRSGGEQLFDIEAIEKTGYTINTNGTYESNANYNVYRISNLEGNTTYTISENQTASVSGTAIRGIAYNSNNEVLGVAFYQNRTAIQRYSYSFTTPANTSYILAQFRISDTEIMLNKGTTALPYTPYEKGWYYKQGIGKVVLDGSENWGNYDTNRKRSNITYANLGITPKAYDSNCLSNYFINADTEQNIGFNLGSNALYLRIDNSFTDITQFKSWLSTNKPIFYLPLATPTYTKITGELANQLEQVNRGMLSYDGTTNISQVNNDLPFELVGSAIQKL